MSNLEKEKIDIDVSSGGAALNSISNTQSKFQPNYTNSNFIKPGDVKITSVYESDYNNNDLNSPYNMSDKRDIIPKEDIERAERMSDNSSLGNIQSSTTGTGYGVIGTDGISSISNPIITPITTPKTTSTITSASNSSDDDDEKRNSVLPVGRWILTVLVLCIPGINLIFLLVWAFGKGNRARQNLCRALLIITVVFFGALAAILYFVGVSEIVDFFKNLIQQYHVKDYVNKYILK